MKIRLILACAMVALLLNTYACTTEPSVPSVTEPSLPSLNVRNAAQAVDAALSYLRQHEAQNAPDVDIKWQEKTIYSGGPVDLATTSKQFTSDDWAIEVSQNLAPLSGIVYQVTVFSPRLRWHWKGSVNAYGSITEMSAFRLMSEEESKKMAEEFLARGQIPPPQGGYGK